ncbi:MAG: hypothetical protein IPK82_27940 [Polyangiaceae bacterium]|nr:hypothetical protein [Polyangiaceae bacterium]
MPRPSYAREIFRYGTLLAIEGVLVYYSLGVDLSTINSWLVGINFVLAVSAVNFTFFGHQLSRYKPLLGALTTRQWVNIVTLSALPFLPLVVYLIHSAWFSRAALWTIPFLMWSAYDSALLTATYLDPHYYLRVRFSDIEIRRYTDRLLTQARTEVAAHNKLLERIKSVQVPIHGRTFEPTAIGLRDQDLWDQLTTIIKLSVENNDYSAFAAATDAVIRLLSASYDVRSADNDAYSEREAVGHVSHTRFRAIVNWLLDKDKEGTHVQALVNNLCGFIASQPSASLKKSRLVGSLLSDLAWVGRKMLAKDELAEPLKIVNTIHAVVELLQIQSGPTPSDADSPMEELLLSQELVGYAHFIGRLGAEAFDKKRPHVAYRCMETLSYIGCNAAKDLPRGRRMVAACLAALVQIGRTARATAAKCFWHACIIPPEGHSEEFMGHILTWLVKGIGSDGKFPLKSCAEQAYSRIRGKACSIVPRLELNPFFWIQEKKDGPTGESLPHIERMSGRFGYSGTLDYSRSEDLKDYELYDMD